MRFLPVLLFSILLAPIVPAAAESWQHDGIKIVDHPEQIQITTPRPSSVSHFVLKAPARFVIDIKGVTVSRNGALTLKSSPLGISSVRLGRRGKETRVVLDCVNDATCQTLTLSTEGGAIVVRSNSKRSAFTSAVASPSLRSRSAGGEAPEAPSVVAVRELGTHRSAAKAPAHAAPSVPLVQPLPEIPSLTGARFLPAATPPPTPLPPKRIEEPAPRTSPTPPAATPTPVPSATSTMIPQSSPPPSSTAATPTSAPTVARSNTQRSGPALEGIQFDYLMPERNPVIRFAFDSRREYRLTKIDPTTYELTVLGAVLGGDHLALHFFPPNDFLGFTYVKPRQEGKSVAISIGVDYGMRIASVPKDNEIWVKSVSR